MVTVQENGEPILFVPGVWWRPPGFPAPGADVAVGSGIRVSKGVPRLPGGRPGVGDQALVLPETDDGRLLFIVPWRGLALLGTTDTPFDGDPGKVRPDKADVEYLERHLRRYVDCSGATPLASFAGLRTLTDGRDSTASASRQHRILEQGPGMFTVVGGKLSSARAIASEVVDRACTYLRVDTPSRTSDAMLVGGGISTDLRTRLRSGLERIGLPAATSDHLIRRYGPSPSRCSASRDRPGMRLLMDPTPISRARSSTRNSTNR